MALNLKACSCKCVPAHSSLHVRSASPLCVKSINKKSNGFGVFFIIVSALVCVSSGSIPGSKSDQEIEVCRMNEMSAVCRLVGVHWPQKQSLIMTTGLQGHVRLFNLRLYCERSCASKGISALLLWHPISLLPSRQ